ncbi:hypothetical protein [Paracoccus sanguinis]
MAKRLSISRSSVYRRLDSAG